MTKCVVWLSVIVCFLWIVALPVDAKKKNLPPKLIYVPHDNRPISDEQTAAVAERLGYEVVVPANNMLGDNDDFGNPDYLWSWLEGNAKNAEAAVLSADALLYGSLVGSRQHSYTTAEIIYRADKFIKFRKKFPKLRLYVFSSIMRTPKSGAASGHMEPPYYQSYGADIFRYTALNDKASTEKLTYREQKEQKFLQKLIPKNDLADWLGRREKNFAANEHLIDLTRQNTFDYFVLGRDDNAPFSQTHMESRNLIAYSQGLGREKFQNIAGIDEIGMLLLTRAINDLRHEIPFVYVKYNWGTGERTVPSYSDEPLSRSVIDEITTAGAMTVTSPEKADLVLMINTNPNGKTYEAAARNNTIALHEGTAYFAELVEEMTKKDYPVAVADVAYANGSDNGVMEELRKRGLLFKLRSYSGWNTATNSVGFAIGEGLLARHMDRAAINELLLTRYLDDWAYQGNVRNMVARQLTWLRGDGVYGRLDEKRNQVRARTVKMMTAFIEDNIMQIPAGYKLVVDFPWNRMFEANISWTNELTN